VSVAAETLAIIAENVEEIVIVHGLHTQLM
jgi:hypothetical protein